MKKNFFTILLILVAGMGIMKAENIDGINYNLNTENLTAEVADDLYAYGEIIIPSTVVFEGKTFNVISIRGWAFNERYLTSIEIPNSVTSIGEHAFSGCTSLTSIEISNSVTSIGSSAFAGCSGLMSIVVDKENTTYDSRDNCNAIIETNSNTLIAGCKNTIIPNSVTSIGERAFSGCTSLTSIEIPNSVVSIGDNAFNYVPNIVYSGTAIGSPWGAKSVNGYVDGYLVYSDATKINLLVCSTAATGKILIPNSVTSIGDEVFYNCSSLESVTIGNGVKSIGESAFFGCSGLTSIEIPNSVTSIGKSAFGGCSGLTSIEIPNSVTSIGNAAFVGCSGLTSIEIPNSVVSIGGYAFISCSKITSVIWNTKNCAYNSFCFSDCPVVLLTFGDEVESIPAHCCQEMEHLTNVTIGKNVTSIGEYAFFKCSNLKAVTIGKSVTSIGAYAFDSSGLTSIIWNAKNCVSPTSYSDAPFYRIRTQITSFSFGNEVESIPAYCCEGLKQLTSVTIPNSVTSIGVHAFDQCENLTSVTWNAKDCVNSGYFGRQVTSFIFGNEVESIPAYCCKGMKQLTSINIPNSVTGIGDDAFRDCSGLKSMTIPNSVTSIGDSAFCKCSNLKDVTIGNSVTSIGERAFHYCTSLTRITCEAVTPPICGNNVFYNVDKSIPLYVPANSVNVYKAAEKWQDFANILPVQQATEVTIIDIQAEPADNSVVIEWPSVAEATIYTIEIKKNGELICTLTFNELGQLQNISFAKPSRNGGRDSQVRTATQTTTGWQYTIAGLETNTTYTYNVIAKRNASDTDNLYDKTITFTTKNTPTNIDAVVGTNSQVKQIRNGQLLINRDGKVYNAHGMRVE